MAVGVNYLDIFDNNDNIKLISGVDLVIAELQLLFTLEKYSLFFGNEMGLDLDKYIYTNNKLATFNLIRSDIEKFFKRYSKAALKKLEMKFDKTGMVTIDIYIDVGGVLASTSVTLSKGE
jgi:hypothetical protein